MPVYIPGRERTSNPRPGTVRRGSEHPLHFPDKEDVSALADPAALAAQRVERPGSPFW